MTNPLLLIGCGNIATHYVQTLKYLKKSFTVVGNSKENALKFEKSIGQPVYYGGIEAFLSSHSSVPKTAIVAANSRYHLEIVNCLIKHGINKILLEKPGSLTMDEFSTLNQKLLSKKTKVYLAYNRRFYRSVDKAKEILQSDGGLISIKFDFTEWTHKINQISMHPKEKKYLVLSNSTHVIDLAFHFAGLPKTMTSYTKHKMEWHPDSALFLGMGVTEKNIPFSYHSNWLSPGRWKIELYSKSNKLTLSPLEELKVQYHESFTVHHIPLESSVEELKEGFLPQLTDFLSTKPSSKLCTFSEHFQAVPTYYKIAGY